MRFALFQRVNGGLADVPRRDEVGFADAERNHVLHLRDDFEKVADAERGRWRRVWRCSG